jgi:hypothetical protein
MQIDFNNNVTPDKRFSPRRFEPPYLPEFCLCFRDKWIIRTKRYQHVPTRRIEFGEGWKRHALNDERWAYLFKLP